MPKVDIMLAIVQASIMLANDPRVNKVFADLANARSTLQWICQNQDDNGDVMARDAVLYAMGQSPKPQFMQAAGL